MFPHVKVPPHKPNNLSTMPRTHGCAGHSWAHLQSQHSGSEVGGQRQESPESSWAARLEHVAQQQTQEDREPTRESLPSDSTSAHSL